jgi:hypothetical protein
MRGRKRPNLDRINMIKMIFGNGIRQEEHEGHEFWAHIRLASGLTIIPGGDGITEDGRN